MVSDLGSDIQPECKAYCVSSRTYTLELGQFKVAELPYLYGSTMRSGAVIATQKLPSSAKLMPFGKPGSLSLNTSVCPACRCHKRSENSVDCICGLQLFLYHNRLVFYEVKTMCRYMCLCRCQVVLACVQPADVRHPGTAKLQARSYPLLGALERAQVVTPR